MTDSRLDDELSVAMIEFTDTPRWLKSLARDPNGFPKKTKYGTLWHMTAVNTTAQDEDGKTEFIRAVISGVDRANLFYPEMLAEFEDIDVNIQDRTGRTALHWASEQGLSDMVRLCLSVPDCDTSLRDNDGLTAFDLAGGGGNGAENIQTLFYSSIFDMEPRDPQSALLRAMAITSEPNQKKPIFPGEALFDSIRDRNSPLVMALIDRQVDLTTRDADGNTALHLAAGQAGNAEIVKKLLVAGADVNAIGAGGATPLHQAMSIVDHEMMRVLLQWTADMKVQDTDNQAPAPENDAADKTALQVAKELHSLETLLESSPEGKARSEEDMRQERFLGFQQLNVKQRKNALLHAASQGDLQSLQVLLEMGIPAEIKNNAHMTPLALASQNGQNEVVKALLAAGVNIEASECDLTALMRASSAGHNDVVETLVAAGADIEGSNSNGTALILASQNGQNEVVKTLLDAGADIEGSNLTGTALVHATLNGHNEVVQTLLAAGANIEAEKFPGTALVCASKEGYNDIVKILLAAGANIEAKYWGGTALLEASRSGYNDIVKMLLAAGADIEASCGGKTALQWALEKHNTDVVDTLRAAGARTGAARVGYIALRKLGVKPRKLDKTPLG